MREETQPYPICVYCKRPITESFPVKGLEHGQKAHLECYIQQLNGEEKKPQK